jgi:phosphoribosylanthranilate isomerase
VRVKICGLREERDVVAAAVAGADYLGFVMAPSRRRVSLDEARALVREARRVGRALYAVGVFVGAAADDVNRAADYCGFDLVQLSGGEDVAYCRLLERPAIRVLHVSCGTPAALLAADVERAEAELPGGRLLHLLDTGAGAAAGGTGCTFDWGIARDVAARHDVIVAGGLTPDNVGELVRMVQPHGVDVSTGVEREGAKDPELIRAFVAAVRRAGKEKVHAGCSLA